MVNDKKLLKVGVKIKELREDSALTLEELSTKCGIPHSILSQIENHLVSPPLGSLIKIARALDVKVGYFFDEGEAHSYSIVRADERKRVSRVASKEGVDYGYQYESLGYDVRDRVMEPFFITLKPSMFEDKGLSSHSGEEFIYVLEGEMEVELKGHTDILKPGDSIYYLSSIPHRVVAHGGKETRILAVIYTA